MKDTKLDSFLSQEQSVGERDSTGDFTLSTDNALRKMAEFQLSSPTDWVLKLIQSFVASGASGPIDFKLGRTDMLIQFDAGPDWTLETIIEQLGNPRAGPQPALYHLAMALWSVGSNQRHCYTLELAKTGKKLVWNGKSLSQEPSRSLPRSQLRIPHRTRYLPRAGGIVDTERARKLNASILILLSTRCFLCPLPLTLDGRRLNGLLRCPSYGFREGRHLAGSGYIESRLGIPSLALPLGCDTIDTYGVSGIGTLFSDLVVAGLPTSRASLVYLLTYHYTPKQKPGESFDGLASPQPSRCYWILDGVVLGSVELNLPSAACSVGVYLSAENLPTDLSTLSLQESDAKTERLRKALIEIAGDLRNFKPLSFHERHRSKKNGTFSAAKFIIAGSLLTLPIFREASVGMILFMLYALTKKEPSPEELRVEGDVARAASSFVDSFQETILRSSQIVSDGALQDRA